MANNKFRSGRERDPIAELAQLIAEADPYGERAAPDNRFRRETASEGHDEAPGVPPAPPLPADVRAPEQTTSSMGIATTTKRMTPIIHPTPPTRTIRLKFPACGGAAWP